MPQEYLGLCEGCPIARFNKQANKYDDLFDVSINPGDRFHPDSAADCVVNSMNQGKTRVEALELLANDVTGGLDWVIGGTHAGKKRINVRNGARKAVSGCVDRVLLQECDLYNATTLEAEITDRFNDGETRADRIRNAFADFISNGLLEEGGGDILEILETLPDEEVIDLGLSTIVDIGEAKLRDQ